VTGGHGFIGSHLVEALIARGDRVRCLVRRAGTPPGLLGLDVEIQRGDVREPASLHAAVEGVDEVYHLAGLTRSLTRREMIETNARGTRRLLEAAAAADTPARFLHCSSLSVVGPSSTGRLLDESAPAAPVSWYGESKVEAERLVLEHAGRLPVTVVRPPIVYGPRDPNMLPFFRAAAGRLLPVLAGTPRSISTVYAADLAQAMIAAARSPATVGRVYFASDPEPVTTERLMDEVTRAVGGRPRRMTLPRSAVGLLARMGDLMAQLTGSAPLLGRQRALDLTGTHWVCSGAALERDTDWRPTTGLVDGVRLTAAWYRDQGWM
jgi:nucleoside-diphosphate-sugar epimerase